MLGRTSLQLRSLWTNYEVFLVAQTLTQTDLARCTLAILGSVLTHGNGRIMFLLGKSISWQTAFLLMAPEAKYCE